MDLTIISESETAWVRSSNPIPSITDTDTVGGSVRIGVLDGPLPRKIFMDLTATEARVLGHRILLAVAEIEEEADDSC